jgi:hypothetical protein
MIGLLSPFYVCLKEGEEEEKKRNVAIVFAHFTLYNKQKFSKFQW